MMSDDEFGVYHFPSAFSNNSIIEIDIGWRERQSEREEIKSFNS